MTTNAAFVGGSELIGDAGITDGSGTVEGAGIGRLHRSGTTVARDADEPVASTGIGR